RRRAAGRGLRDRAPATGGGAEDRDPPRRCRPAAHRMGALLRGRAEVRQRDSPARSRPGGGAVVERAGNLRGGQRHGGVREIAGGGNAGARAPARGKRNPHHRVSESGGTGGDDSEGNLITLCSACHTAIRAYWHEPTFRGTSTIPPARLTGSFSASNLDQLIGYDS